jgi:crotonobetainyl-CoA:carnitine CoA-transferase CaiB-like acyl-CoA transferase
MLLADLGAEVVKVERPGSGDETRAWHPPADHDGTSTYFLSVNRNKKSVVLDLTTEAGLEQARALVAESDVLVENFRPGRRAGSRKAESPSSAMPLWLVGHTVRSSSGTA